MSNVLIQSSKHGKSKNKAPANFAGKVEVASYPLGFLVVLFLGLAIFAFTRPLARTMDNIPYQQVGSFFYSATGTPQVYDTDTVRSGEPIFPKLTCFLNMGFAYNLTGSQLQGASGRHQLYARVMDEQSGWQRTIPLVAETSFSGNSYLTNATLDLCQVEALVSLVEQETGFHQNTYTLKIIPHVDMMAQSAGVAIQDTFEPSLVFKFDEVHFYLAADNAQLDPLHVTKQSSASSSDTQANHLSLLGWKPSVQSARAKSLIGLGLSLGGLLAVSWYTAQKSQQALIQLKYGAILMDVHAQAVERLAPSIDVSKIDDLARIAERQNTMILHVTLNSVDHYLVQGKGVTYRYVISNDKTNVVEVAEAPRKDIRNYTSSTHSKRIVDPKPAKEVVFVDAVHNDKCQAPIAKPVEKIVMRYSMNISKDYIQN